MLILYFALSVFRLTPCEASQKDEVICGPASAWFESVDLSVNVAKRGFHSGQDPHRTTTEQVLLGDTDMVLVCEWITSGKLSSTEAQRGHELLLELLYEVQHDPTPQAIKALVIQRLPSGVYMDQYQLASLREDTGLQVLLDSAVSLEDPAHLSSGFSALVYLSPADGLPGLLQAVVPVHGRYHRPSSSGGWERVYIEGPRLLLRPESCETLPSDLPHRVVEAPCTVQNQSVCSWLEIQGLQVPDSVTLELPVGDFSLTGPVCAGTILATLLCFALLFRTIWKHGIF